MKEKTFLHMLYHKPFRARPFMAQDKLTIPQKLKRAFAGETVLFTH
jgi:hypothetical protein